MHGVKLTIPSDIHHVCQIVTGFLILKEQGMPVQLENRIRDRSYPLHGLPVVMADYRGKRIFYDLWDGYQNPEGIREGLAHCDFCFKRSFSPEKNRELFPEFREKLFPLGFNYHVTHPDNPANEPWWKHVGKQLQGRAPDRYFRPEVFEGTAERRDGPARILFLTRLWEEEPQLSQEDNAERRAINESRIHIIRTLRERYGDRFFGGLNDLPLARSLAPELIVPKQYTERMHYLNLLHSCDICIGTMGLYESIGWKTGEYVAAAKAIVNETFRYQVPGNFLPGQNYLPFETAQECIDAVDCLVSDPDLLFSMKQANENYYRCYLKPEVLVRNTLEVVDSQLDQVGNN